jgi:nitroreductase/dihydropteridine reductase
MDLIHQLNWRYTINRNCVDITPEKLELILDNIRSSGSAFGFSPLNILSIDNCSQINKILPAALYPQLNKASHLLIFTAWTGIRHENINELIAYIASTNGLSLDHTNDYKEVMKILVKSKAEYHLEWSTKQAYIALGVGLTIAGEHKINAVPVETFEHGAIDKILNLKEKGMTCVTMLALGKRNESGETPVKKQHIKKPVRENELPFLMWSW